MTIRDRINNMALKELETLIDIPSESGNEQEIIKYLENRFALMGFRTEHQEVMGGRYNLLVNPVESPLIITAHVDTVSHDVEGEECLRRVDGNIVYGRGAVDIKGGITSIIVAMELLREEGFEGRDLPFTLAFTVDEEKEGRGSQVLAAHFKNSRGAIILEPTELTLGVAQAGSIELFLNFYGRPSHGGEINRGDNAIKRAMNFFQELERLPVLQEEDELVGKAGYNIQWIGGGEKDILIVPAYCQSVVDIHILPRQDIDEVKEVIEQLIEQFGDLDAEYLDLSPSFFLSREESVIKLMQEAGEATLNTTLPFTGVRSWTDAEPLFAEGIPPVIFGPGELSVGHTPFEHVDIEEVVSAGYILAESVRKASMVSEPYRITP